MATGAQERVSLVLVDYIGHYGLLPTFQNNTE